MIWGNKLDVSWNNPEKIFFAHRDCRAPPDRIGVARNDIKTKRGAFYAPLCFHFLPNTVNFQLISNLKQVKPSTISTAQLNTLLHLHLRPIKQVVYLRSYPPDKSGDGRSYLGASFALRCFQRLSLPDVATQLCSRRNNWHTRGLSLSVLSY